MGQPFTIINQSSGVVTVTSSDSSTVVSMGGGRQIAVIANTAAPTTAANWTVTDSWSLNSSTVSGTDGTGQPGQYSVLQSATANSIARRDAAADLSADAFIAQATSTASGSNGGATTLTNDGTQLQILTGTSVHTHTLPTSSVVQWKPFRFINESTQAWTINASNAAFLVTVQPGSTVDVYARQAIPTTPAHWVIAQGQSTVSLVSEYNSSSAAINLSAQTIPTIAGKTLLGVRITAIAPGGGGGSGRKGAANTLRTGGAGGGGGAASYDIWIPAVLITSNWGLIIPTGGAGGAAPSTDDTDGVAGGAGGGGVFFSANSVNLVQVSPASGGAGGAQHVNDVNAGLGGTTAGGAPTSGNVARPAMGGAGAGGGAPNASTLAGQNGADAVGYGAGGGGGSASLNGQTGGAPVERAGLVTPDSNGSSSSTLRCKCSRSWRNTTRVQSSCPEAKHSQRAIQASESPTC